jgi:cyclase
MLSKRVVSCFDVRDGKLVKSVKFVDTKEIGEVLGRAKQYYDDGLDELVMYDITASSDHRSIMLDTVETIASEIFIPFSVGGGIRSVEDATSLRWAGAEKINVNTAAVERPELIAEISHAVGAQSTILSIDVLRVPGDPRFPSGFEIVTHGGRNHTGRDAIAWSREGERLGAGELVVNSIDADGTKDGYDIELTRAVAEAVGVPVIASGGAGKPEHLYDVLTEGGADAALIASMVHYGEYKVSELKRYLDSRGIKMRMNY